MKPNWFPLFAMKITKPLTRRTPTRSLRPILEYLEDRLTPAVIATYDSGTAALTFLRTGGTAAESVTLLSDSSGNQVKFTATALTDPTLADPTDFQSDGGGVYETRNPANVNSVNVNLGTGNSSLIVTSGWGYLIPVLYTGSASTDTLDVSAAAPQLVIANAPDAAGGYDGFNQNLSFSSVDKVVFGSNANDLLDVTITTATAKDFNYAVTGPGAGSVTDTTDGNTLSFSGLDNPGASPVNLSVVDNSGNSELGSQTIDLRASGLSSHNTTISGGDANSPTQMFATFDDLSAADLAFTTPNTSLTFLGDNTANDTVTVQSAPQALNIDTGSGANTVFLGGLAGAGAQQFLGPVDVTSTGGTVGLTIDDTADPSPQTITLSGSDVQGITPFGVTFADLAGLTLEGGSAGNTWMVSNTPSSATTTVEAGAGNNQTTVLATTGALAYQVAGGADTLHLGDAGLTGGLLGSLSIATGSGGSVNLTVDDSADLGGRTATLTGTGLTGLTPGGVTWTAADLSALSLNSGLGNDTVLVNNTPAGIITQLRTEAGNNSITVNTVTTGLSLDGGAGDDTYKFTLGGGSTTIADSGGNNTIDFSGAPAGVTIDMDSTAVQTFAGGTTIQFAAPGIIENFVGSVFADTITAKPLAVPRSIDGNLPVLPTLPGDTLILDNTSPIPTPTGQSVTATGPGSGIFSSTNYAPVTFTSIETFTLTNSNVPPTITADNSSVAAPEFTPVTNTGTYTDVNGSVIISVISGGGTVTQNNALHTWEWFGIAPDEMDPQTLTIQAMNGTGTSATSFSSTENNIIVVNGTSNDDTLIVTATGLVSGSYSLNGAPAVAFAGITSFSFFGGAGNDLMRIIYPTGGTFAPTGGILYDGGTGSNTLELDANGQPLGTVPGALGGQGSLAVQYSNVEQIHLDNAASVNAMASPDTADRSTAFTGLTADEYFVQALYLDALGRAGQLSELDGWVAVLNSPGGSRTAVANGIENSLEGRDHLVKSWYIAYLGRQAQGGEEMGWSKQLSSETEEQVLGGILGSSEFFNRAQTLGFGESANRNFVRSLYQVLLNRTASSSEVDGWVGTLANLSRAGVAQSVLQSPECRSYQFESYYNALLRRPDDEAGLDYWGSFGADRSNVRIAFEASPEFYLER